MVWGAGDGHGRRFATVNAKHSFKALLDDPRNPCEGFTDTVVWAPVVGGSKVESPSVAHQYVLVVFLGGATLSEIAALRNLGLSDGVHYIFVTTALLTAQRMLSSIIC